MTLPIADRLLLPLRLARARLRGAFVPAGSLPPPLTVQSFDLDFDEGEASYHAMGRSADGRIVFAVGTKSLHAGARLFAFDPRSGAMARLADLDAALPSPDARAIPQGKVHTELIALDDALVGATHVGYYDPGARIERPGRARGFAPYPGGWFFALRGERIEALAQAPAGEGIITLSADARRRKMFALTWPRGLLLSLDLDARALRDHGPVLGDAETGSRRAGTWSRVCRSLGIDDAGIVLWCDGAGRITALDGESQRVVATTPRAEMWRKVLWHAAERVFYGTTWNSSTLFRFDPASRTCEEIGSLQAPGSRAAATLALSFDAAQRALHTLATGPGLMRGGALPLASTVTHVRFDLATRTSVASGPLRIEDGRWVTQSQSLLMDGETAYALAWIEVPSSDRSARARRIRALRRNAPEYRTRGYAEEMRLLRFTPGGG